MKLLKHVSSWLVLLSPFIISSCDGPACKNTNAVFESFSPNSKEYKKELAIQLNLLNSEDLTFWLNEYVEENGKEYLYVYIQGENLCAEAPILVTNWQKLEGIKRTKGVSYEGAELKGLRFAIIQDQNYTQFVYKDIEKVLD